MYRIKERLYSSNIIERGTYTEDGKIKWDPFIAPLVKKEEGDLVCETIFKNIEIMANNRHIWEGWTVQDFIDELEPQLDMIQAGQSWQSRIISKDALKNWCIDNQPYYKKHIPEVVNYFAKKYNITVGSLPISDAEHKKVSKAIYPKDNSGKFRRQ